MARIKSIGIASGKKTPLISKKEEAYARKFEKTPTGETLPAGSWAKLQSGITHAGETPEEKAERLKKVGIETPPVAKPTPEPEQKGTLGKIGEGIGGAVKAVGGGIKKFFEERKDTPTAFDVPVFRTQGMPVYNELGPTGEYAGQQDITLGKLLLYGAAAQGSIPTMGAVLSKGTQIASGDVSHMGKVAEASSGWLPEGKLIIAPGSKIAKLFLNPKVAKLTTGYLTKLVAGLKNPILHLSIISAIGYTSLFWGPNEKSDALTTAVITMRDAVRAGKPEEALETGDTIESAVNISASVPIKGFGESEAAKVETALQAARFYREEALAMLDEKRRLDLQMEARKREREALEPATPL